MPAKKEIIEAEDYSALLAPYSKLYLICDRVFEEMIPALDSEGRAVCFTNDTDAAEYAQRIKDAQCRALEPAALANIAMSWRFLGIEKFLLFTAKDSFEEHTRAELLGHNEKCYLNDGYHFLRIRLRQARKYASAAKSDRKYCTEGVNYTEKVRLLEYQLHSYMNDELILLMPVKVGDEGFKMNENMLFPSWDASGILTKKGIYSDFGQHIFGGKKYLDPSPGSTPEKLIMYTLKDNNDTVYLPVFTDRKRLKMFYSNMPHVTWMITFNDLYHNLKNLSEKHGEGLKLRGIINPDYMEYSMSLEAAENILGTGQDNNKPKHLKNLSGKHTRINITGGKNNGCNS